MDDSKDQQKWRRTKRGPNSRNACLQCKQRHVKCDEKRPSCLGCIGKGLLCSHAPRLRWSMKHSGPIGPPHHDGQLKSHESTNFVVSKDTHQGNMIDMNFQQYIVPPDSNTRSSTPPSVRYCTSSSRSPSQLPFRPTNTSVFNSVKSPSATPISTLPSLSATSTPSDTTSADANHKNTDSHVTTSRMYSIPNHLNHLPSSLVQHYFAHVCTTFSAFDSSQNYFRSAVGSLWQGYGPVYFAIQSMAAATLSDRFPKLSVYGISLQQIALRSLKQELECNGEKQTAGRVLLTIILLGMTTSWHKSGDIGTGHQAAVRNLLNERHKQHMFGLGAVDERETEFFEQCLLHWEMLTAFVTDGSNLPREGPKTYNMNSRARSNVLLFTRLNSADNSYLRCHPMTGFTPKLQYLFARAAYLVRSNRMKQKAQSLSKLDYLSFEIEQEPWESEVEELEEDLVGFTCPTEDALISCEDPKTLRDHFMKMDQLYRCTALLMVYRVWPVILRRRLEKWSLGPIGPFLACVPDVLSLNMGYLMPSHAEINRTLRCFALHIVKLLQEIPTTSGTRCLQPLLLVAVSNELRFTQPPQSCRLLFDKPNTECIDLEDMDVSHGRAFITARLAEFESLLPSKPLAQMEKVISETWLSLDLGHDAFWLDIMIENGWETVMG